MFDRLKAWLFWRLPRLWMNRTAYAFWVMEQRQLLQRRARLEKRATLSPEPSALKKEAGHD